MKTIKFIALILLTASIVQAQTIRQNQVRALPDSLLKKLDISQFNTKFDTRLAAKTLDNIAAGATYKAVTDSEKAVWNGKVDTAAFNTKFDAQLATKTLDNIAAGATYKAVTDSEKAVWNAKLDTSAADGRYKRLDQDGYKDTTNVITLADSASVTFPTGVAGWGKCMIGDSQEKAEFTFDSAGVITLDSSSVSANISTTFEDDAKLVIYDAGSGIGIRNMLGSSLKLAFKIEYYTP